MDAKLFKRTFPFVCNDCGEFAHTEHAFCDKCGAQALRKAKKEDYKNHKK
jgi:rRNA maturation endonuclease Nob1